MKGLIRPLEAGTVGATENGVAVLGSEENLCVCVREREGKTN